MSNFKKNCQSLIDALKTSKERTDIIDKICDECISCLRHGGTIFACGNGGSSTDAAHLIEELTGRYKLTRPALRGICLNTDAAALTCIANDFGYESVFSRQLEALAKPKDILILFSTSGNSKNQVVAIEQAKRMNVMSILLTGRDGGKCSKIADISLIIPSEIGARIQEIHSMVLHTIIEAIEESLFDMR